MSYQDYTLMPSSEIDQEFLYTYELLSYSFEDNSKNQFQQMSQEIASQSQVYQSDFYFKDPTYTKRADPKKKLESPEIKTPEAKKNSLHNASGIQQRRENQATVSNSDESGQSSSQSYESRPSNSNNKKSKKGKRQQYPTKNFLPSFRSSFINYLAKHFESDYFYSLEIIRRIKGKPCINLTDYEDLFRVPQFRPVLKVYFKDRVIVRDLMQSRIQYETKKVYFKRLHVFEEAFESGVFEKIN